MRFDLYKDGIKFDKGNLNMLKTYTDVEIKEFYKRFNITVIIER
jgi:hypothetical protein